MVGLFSIMLTWCLIAMFGVSVGLIAVMFDCDDEAGVECDLF